MRLIHKGRFVLKTRESLLYEVKFSPFRVKNYWSSVMSGSPDDSNGYHATTIDATSPEYLLGKQDKETVSTIKPAGIMKTRLFNFLK